MNGQLDVLMSRNKEFGSRQVQKTSCRRIFFFFKKKKKKNMGAVDDWEHRLPSLPNCNARESYRIGERGIFVHKKAYIHEPIRCSFL